MESFTRGEGSRRSIYPSLLEVLIGGATFHSTRGSWEETTRISIRWICREREKGGFRKLFFVVSFFRPQVFVRGFSNFLVPLRWSNQFSKGCCSTSLRISDLCISINFSERAILQNRISRT